MGLAIAVLCLILSSYEGLKAQLENLLSELETDVFEVLMVDEAFSNTIAQVRANDPEGLALFRSPYVDVYLDEPDAQPAPSAPPFFGFDRTTVEGLLSLPSVEAVAWRQADPPLAASARVSLEVWRASPSFFALAGLRVERGRLPVAADRPEGVVIGHRAAWLLFGDQDPLNRIVRTDPGAVPEGISPSAAGYESVAPLSYTPYEFLVVGVLAEVADARGPLDQHYETAVWRVNGELEGAVFSFLVKPRAGQEAEARQAIRAALGSLEQGEQHLRITPLAQQYSQAVLAQFLELARSGLLWISVLALLLAGVAVGTSSYFGLMLRYREMGIRRGLGATATRLLAQTARESLLLGAAACVVGLALAWVVRPLAAAAWEAWPRFGPLTLASAFSASFLISLTAALLPGRRLLRLSPAVMFRGPPLGPLTRRRWLLLGPGLALSMLALVVTLALRQGLVARMDQILGWVGARTVSFIFWDRDFADGVKLAYLTSDDYGAVREAFPGWTAGWLGDTRKRVVEASASLPALRPVRLQHGRWFTAEEESSQAAVVVLGSRAAAKIAPGGDVTQIKSWQGYRVVGILDEWEGMVSAGFSPQQIYTPIGSEIILAEQNWPTGPPLLPGQLMVAIPAEDDLGRAAIALRDFLAERHPEGTPQLVLPAQATEAMLQQRNRILDVAGWLAGLCFAIGVIGLMNLSFVSALARAREIGLRRALGATRGAIARQMIGESVRLCVVAAGVGAAVGLLVSHLLQQQLGWPAGFNAGPVFWAAALAVVGGALAGVLPAWWAATLDPTQAVRME